MKYKSIAELDAAIERRIKKTVKHYVSDWTDYDKPKYEKIKKSDDRKERRFTLIARESGTYLFTEKDIETTSTAKEYIKYYKNNDGHDVKFYDVDIDKKTIKLVYQGE